MHNDMMKKSLLVLGFYLLVSLIVVAQSSGGTDAVNDCLRFMPTRVTTGVRTVREYRPSTVVMGARELLATTHYDRQGYMTMSGRKILD